jgi:hypothetical protein
MKLLIVVLAVATLGSSVYGGSISQSLQTLFIGARYQDVIIDFPQVFDKVINSSSSFGTLNDVTRSAIVNDLRTRTRTMQEPVMKVVRSLELDNRATQFWIANRIAIRGVEVGPLRALAAVPMPFIIREAYKAKIFPVEVVEENVRFTRQTASSQAYGVDKINAPNVWAKSNTGKGVVVGNTHYII